MGSLVESLMRGVAEKAWGLGWRHSIQVFRASGAAEESLEAWMAILHPSETEALRPDWKVIGLAEVLRASYARSYGDLMRPQNRAGGHFRPMERV